MGEPSQADIYAALTAQTSFRRSNPPLIERYESFSDPKNDLIKEKGGKKVNSRRLYCSREGCGSVILSEGVGEWIELDGPVLPHDPSSPFPSPPASSSAQTQAHWYIPQSPFAFDNIGFSRPDSSTTLPSYATPPTSGQSKVKWLICAECDLGPIGWSYEGGNVSWVAVDRVQYGEIKK